MTGVQTCALPIYLSMLYVSLITYVKIQVSDNAGNTGNATSNFRIGILRAIPGASPTSGPSPLTVRFTTDGEDPAGTIQIFRWDFDGNGSWDRYDTVARDYNHTYNNSGVYNATLYVQSSTGKTAKIGRAHV